MEVVIKLQLFQLTQLCRSTQMKTALLATGLILKHGSSDKVVFFSYFSVRHCQLKNWGQPGPEACVPSLSSPLHSPERSALVILESSGTTKSCASGLIYWDILETVTPEHRAARACAWSRAWPTQGPASSTAPENHVAFRLSARLGQ